MFISGKYAETDRVLCPTSNLALILKLQVQFDLEISFYCYMAILENTIYLALGRLPHVQLGALDIYKSLQLPVGVIFKIKRLRL